jgi:hypothetical protein
MLEQVLRHINNFFEVDMRHGEYTVEDGSVTLPFLQEGQYFRIVGSVFNDGVYQYPASGLTDETFDGSVWALAVPKEVLELAEEIKGWQEKYGDVSTSPYTNESFGGYSYTKAANEATGSGATWQGQFRSRLNTWRKI